MHRALLIFLVLFASACAPTGPTIKVGENRHVFDKPQRSKQLAAQNWSRNCDELGPVELKRCLREEAANLEDLESFQEASWIYDLLGDYKKADASIEAIASVYAGIPIEEDIPRRGISKKVTLTFLTPKGKRLRALFKPWQADPDCTSCTAGRAIATYRLDRMLEFYSTPYTYEYRYSPISEEVCDYFGKSWDDRSKSCETIRGSIQYWLQGSLSVLRSYDEKSNKTHFFDSIVGNSDRHLGNILKNANNRQLFIDHNRTFLFEKEVYDRWHNSCWEREIDDILDPMTVTGYLKNYQLLTLQLLEKFTKDVLYEEEIAAFISHRSAVIDRLHKNGRPRPYNTCVNPPRSLGADSLPSLDDISPMIP